MKCLVPSCDIGEWVPYTTKTVEREIAWVLMMQMHSTAGHSTAAQQTGKASEGCPQAKRVKCPTLTLNGQSISQEDYDPFLFQFSLYKKQPGPGYNSATILRVCLAEDVSKMLYSSQGTELTKFTEQQLSQNMVTRCVSKTD